METQYTSDNYVELARGIYYYPDDSVLAVDVPPRVRRASDSVEIKRLLKEAVALAYVPMSVDRYGYEVTVGDIADESEALEIGELIRSEFRTWWFV